MLNKSRKSAMLFMEDTYFCQFDSSVGNRRPDGKTNKHNIAVNSVHYMMFIPIKRVGPVKSDESLDCCRRAAVSAGNVRRRTRTKRKQAVSNAGDSIQLVRYLR